MEFPSKVKVGWSTYRVNLWAQREANEYRKYGQCRHETRQIDIANDIDDQQKAHTLLHEIMHACWYVFEHDYMEVHDKDKAKDHEEHYVSAMSSAMATVMRDNPEVFQWVQWALRGE